MLNPGQILDDKYEVIKVLGRGGMSTVYLCKNNRLGNLWAVKEVDSQWKNKIDFLAEPNILKNLSHIGVIRIIDIFHEDDNLYIVEDYIEGKTLKEHVEVNGPLKSELVSDIALQLCSILGYLHSFNPPIIYRDLKPANIMIKPNNKVVLIDFGIARTYKENQEGDTMILGSMGYIAPEQLVNAQSNAQTDIYSLGATMFFMLTGKSISFAFELMDEAIYPENVAKSLVGIIQKASAIEPEMRYSDVLEMQLDINANSAEVSSERTMLMNSNESHAEATKAVLLGDKKVGNKTKFIIIAVLACIIALVVILALMMNNKPLDKNAAVAANTTEETKPKVVEPPKEVIEVDKVVKGILDMNNPEILSSGTNKEKGKGKDKHKDDEDEENQLVQFTLNPAAAISNSKLSTSLTKIQVRDKEVTVILSIQNTADTSLKLDLSKTYIVNDKYESINSYNPDSTNMLSIPQNSEKQEFKLYFKDLEFQEGAYILKTVLSSTTNKDINLSLDVIK